MPKSVLRTAALAVVRENVSRSSEGQLFKYWLS